MIKLVAIGQRAIVYFQRRRYVGTVSEYDPDGKWIEVTLPAPANASPKFDPKNVELVRFND